ncbi:MAG TPA: HEAT repeat domain-containing protein [Planctomycetota bacterium]
MGAIALLLALSGVEGLLQDPIGDFLRRLRDDDPAARDAAASGILERWKDWAAADLDALRAAAADPDVEVSARARQTALRVEIRRRLGAAAFAELPGVDAVLASGPAERRIAALKDVAILVELGRVPDASLHALARLAAEQRWPLPPADVLALAITCVRPLAPLVAPIAGDADPGLAKAAIDLLGRAGAVELFDRIIPRLAAPEPRAAAIDVLGQTDARGHAAAVAALLRSGDEPTRAAAAEVLGRMGAAEHAGDVAALLRGSGPDTLRLAAEALGRMSASGHAEEAAALLGHEDAFVRAEAAAALGRMRALAPRLVPLLRDPESRVKVAAAEALAAIGDASVAPDLAALLREKDTSLLGFAAQILGRLGAKERADDIAALLLHNQPWTRAQAARALARLGSLKHLDLLIGLVDDEWDLVRTTSAIALGEMADLEWPKEARAEASKALRKAAVKDSSGETRVAAASAALRLDGPDEDLERRLLRDVNPEEADAPGALLETLARLREPRGREKLDREIALDAPVGSAEALKAAAAKAGLALTLPEETRVIGRAPAGRTTVRRLIGFFWEGAVPHVAGGTVRPLPITGALAEWRDYPRKK